MLFRSRYRVDGASLSGDVMDKGLQLAGECKRHGSLTSARWTEEYKADVSRIAYESGQDALGFRETGEAIDRLRAVLLREWLGIFKG